jgi:hypothetical protein
MPWTDTGDWSCTCPPQFSIPHNKPHSTSPTIVCLQHLIQYICSHSPCWRKCNWTWEWPIKISKWRLWPQEMGWKDRHCTAWVCNMQLTATLVNCVYTVKIHSNLNGQIYHCYLSTYSPHTNPNNGMARCHKMLETTAVQLQWYSCLTAKTLLMIHKELNSGRQNA